jgi:hypothetical protein
MVKNKKFTNKNVNYFTNFFVFLAKLELKTNLLNKNNILR